MGCREPIACHGAFYIGVSGAGTIRVSASTQKCPHCCTLFVKPDHSAVAADDGTPFAISANMKCSRILPINTSPPIRGYLKHAFLFSILATRDSYLPWLYGGSYSQLVFDRDPGWMPLDFYAPLGYSGSAFACPYLDAQWFGRSVVDGGYGSVTPFLLDSIDDGYYARLVVDEYGVPGRAAYERRHFLHALLVFGYEGSDFHILGYNANGVYESSRISFSQMERAFSGGSPGPSGSSTPPAPGVHAAARLYDKGIQAVDLNRLWLIRYNEEARYRFDVTASWRMLEDYCAAAATPDRFASIISFPNKVYALGQEIPEQEDLLYGVDVYEGIEWWLGEVAAARREFDIIPFHILWEHKAVILQLLEFMEADGHLDLSVRASERFAQIQAQVAQLRLLMLRCAMDLSQTRLTRSIPPHSRNRPGRTGTSVVDSRRRFQIE